MNILVALDSFKGSLSSKTAGEAVKEGFLSVMNDAVCEICQVADGGEGTLDAVSGKEGEIKYVSAHSPTLDIISVPYAVKGNTAIIESAKVIGLELVPKNRRDPMILSSFGLGEVILDAVRDGARDIIIGIGGSSTNDCGIGMLSALGFEFFSENGERCVHGTNELRKIKYINKEKAEPLLSQCRFTVACDVTNPLCGENGCTFVYAAQKGLDPAFFERTDADIRRFSALTKKHFASADENAPGAGAAGGLGFAFMSYLGSSVKSGIDTVLTITDFEEKVKRCDLVITGEGRLDSQSANGKAPVGIARIAKKHGKKVIAFAGSVSDDTESLVFLGIDASFPILRSVMTLEKAMDKDTAYKNLKTTAAEVARLISLYRR